MTDLAEFERRVLTSVSRRLHQRLREAADADIPAEAFGDPEDVAAAMTAALPSGHVFDTISGPYYDSAGLTEWLGITRQALSQRAQKLSLLSCPTDGGGLVYPTWQFTDAGATIPALGDVLRALAGGTSDRWMMALWMQASSDSLDGMRPSEWLRSGRAPAHVLDMAKAIADRWAH